MLVGAVGQMQFVELLFQYVLPNEIKHLWLDATSSIEGSAGFLEKPHGIQQTDQISCDQRV